MKMWSKCLFCGGSTLSTSVSDSFSGGWITEGPGAVLSLKGGTNFGLAAHFLPLPFLLSLFDFLFCVVESIRFVFFGFCSEIWILMSLNTDSSVTGFPAFTLLKVFLCIGGTKVVLTSSAVMFFCV